MSTTVILNGLSYSIPAEGDANWGLNVSNYLIAIASACLQKTGGAYTLTAEVDFGATYGLKLSYVKSRAANPSSAGIFRLGNNESIGWRNAANTGDLFLKATTSDKLEFNGINVPLTGSIVDADISASAAITLSKLAALTASRVLVSDASGVISASSVTSTTLGYLDATSSIQTQLNGKEPTISNLPVSKGGTGSTTALNNNRIMQSSGGNIVEAAAITAARVLISDSNGIPTHSSVTNTTLSYLDATSSIQTQLNGKEPTITTLPISKGGTNSSTALTNDRVIISNGGKIVESSTTTTTLGYLDATSSIQTQLNAKAPLASPSLTTPDIGAAKGASLVLAASSPTLNGSAILQADSTTKGFLPPRMTQAQRDAISTPATGLEVYNTDTNKLNIYNGTSWGEVGSGGGGINYITATDGTIISGWATYADAAGTDPVDGTGGSANVTFATSTNSDLRGTTNFLFTHDANNRQGQGFSYDFTIDKADQAKMLQIRFDYLVASGTYADGDLTVWVYDKTNSKLIQPDRYKILNAIGSQPWLGEFQAAADSTSYRVIFHVSTNTATAYTMRFDAISVGPQMNRAYGTPVTDWVSYTPTITSGAGTIVSTITGNYRRVGDSAQIQIQYTYTSGTGAAADFNLSLPGGLVVDAAKSPSGGLYGSGYYFSTAAGFKGTEVRYATTTSVKFTKDAITGFIQGTDADDAGAVINATFTVPISGWSSNTVMSSDAATNVVAAFGSKALSGTIPTAETVIDFGSTIDTNGAITTGASWKFTAPVAGKYKVTAHTEANSTGACTLYLKLYKNTTLVNASGHGVGATGYQMVPTITGIVDMNANDYIQVKAIGSNANGSYVNDANLNWINIERISGPTQIAASSVVSFVGSSTTGQSITANTTKFTFSAYKDSNSGWSTDTYTVPISGDYQVSLSYYQTTSGAMAAYVHVDGADPIMGKAYLGVAGGTSGYAGSGTVILPNLKAEQLITIKGDSTQTLSSGNRVLSIHRLGGVM